MIGYPNGEFNIRTNNKKYPIKLSIKLPFHGNTGKRQNYIENHDHSHYNNKCGSRSFLFAWVVPIPSKPTGVGARVGGCHN